VWTKNSDNRGRVRTIQFEKSCNSEQRTEWAASGCRQKRITLFAFLWFIGWFSASLWKSTPDWFKFSRCFSQILMFSLYALNLQRLVEICVALRGVWGARQCAVLHASFSSHCHCSDCSRSPASRVFSFTNMQWLEHELLVPSTPHEIANSEWLQKKMRQERIKFC
jgi:hypothetical protein